MAHDPIQEPSTKPYLIRAIHEWCTDSGYTPYLAVSVNESTRVPLEHVKNGEIILNLSPLATGKMLLGNDLIEFQARFGGVARAISVPVDRVSAIYARENGHGMAFEVARSAVDGQALDAPSLQTPPTTPLPDRKRASDKRRPLAMVDAKEADDPENKKSESKGKAKLTIVK